MSERRLVIERLGHRGEGVARTEDGLVFVPFALPGETVLAETAGDHGRLIEVLEPSRARIAPFCPHYGVCGGCAVETLAPAAYAEWKRGLVATALRNAGLDMEVAPLVDAHGKGRRRVTFHARVRRGSASVGFMRARSHAVVEIDVCPLLDPALAGAPLAARAVAQTLREGGKPLDIVVSSTMNGLDVDIRGAGVLEERETRALIEAAEICDLARLSNHRRLVALRRPPVIAIGAALVTPPPGAFLQATQAGEAALAARVEEAAGGAKRVADLFCGLGAFALRLAENASVAAYDSDAFALEALREAARASVALRPIETHARDLFRRPLSAEELESFDAVVFDPPRAGAPAQARAIAASEAPIVIAVSCNPQTFVRDAEILIEAGYAARSVQPIDQFRCSPHVEIVAAFERKARASRKRAILSR